MLLQKPSLTNKMWKSLACGSFINLQKFSYKNMINNVKCIGEDTLLQSSDSGIISIKKCPRNSTFQNISEWLLAFKAYMNAVLILYENREQKLNIYRNHINELYIEHDFLAVLGYDKNQRIALVVNWDAILIDQDIEA
ncbi:22778_t:CDS:1 [Gigaspora margarita]|uniref:22778_t:CDS:1 n=1 Tax=Gigaspora margarita TaxID=4874 RepID=A0ABN7W6M4_GIGMA|nr:22778_t:CDS:1 [Gigaspora margarita]